MRDGFLPVWTAMHAKWARQQRYGRHVHATKSGHGIHVDEPELHPGAFAVALILLAVGGVTAAAVS